MDKKVTRLILVLTLMLMPLISGCASTRAPVAVETPRPSGLGPLYFNELRLEKTRHGTPQVILRVTNIGGRNVKAFTAEATCKDAYGHWVKRYHYGEITQHKIYQETIKPGETREVTWTLYGLDTAYTAIVTLTSAIDVNDKKWKYQPWTSWGEHYRKTVSFGD